jgi:hypothetical protein
VLNLFCHQKQEKGRSFFSPYETIRNKKVIVVVLLNIVVVVVMAEARRTAKVARKTKETDIEVEIDLDGTGNHEIDTGIGFLDHMFAAVSKHGRFDLKLK